jgi:LPS-assembly protein
MRKPIIILILFALCLSCDRELLAKDLSVLSFNEGSPVEINADSIEYLIEKNMYIITGNASLKSDESVLTADEIKIDLNSDKAHARGNAVVTTAGETITAAEIEMDLNTSLGAVVQGKIFVRSENFYITGDSLERISENEYVVENGTFTTCDGDTPSWKFSASHLDIEIDGYVSAKHPVFYVKDIPAFYLPYIIFPIKKTRQSGFLIPAIGHSTDDGTIFKLPYYQVISDSMDATFTLDTRSDRGTGLDTEFRYVLSGDSRGELNWYVMDEFSKDENRWSLSFRHQENFSPTVSLKTDLKSISDRYYFLDFGNDADDRNKEKLESNITLTKSFNNANIQVEHSYDKDLIYDEPLGVLSDTNTQFPKMTASLYKSRIGGSPFSYAGTAVFNNYIQKRFDDLSYLKLEPKLLADFNLGDYAVFSPQITLEKVKFWLHDDPLNDNDNYYSYSTGAALSSKIMRVFDVSDTFKIRHLINPVIEYEYIPKQSVYESFYTLAGIKGEKNEVTLRLINRFNTRRGSNADLVYAEPLRLEIAQGYDIYEAERDLDPAVLDDERRPLKPLYVDADVKAADYFTLNGELYHDHYMKDHIRQYNVSMELKDSRNDRLKVRHTYLKDSDNYLETFLDLNLGHGVSVNNTVRYDYIEQEALETTYGIYFAMQCWGMRITYSEELVEDADDPLAESYIDKTVFLYVSLKGVGDTKDIAISAK